MKQLIKRMCDNPYLTQGCLVPVKVIIPEGTLLNPYTNAAVVGGNVLTSQRVCDVILKAFNACGASQGCMNNITFGDDTMGYYETVAGGAGAVSDAQINSNKYQWTMITLFYTGPNMGRKEWNSFSHDQYSNHRS